MPARKPLWSPAQWVDFGWRCQLVRARLDDLIRTFPATAGLKPAHIDGLIAVTCFLNRAMRGAEHVFSLQCPDLGPRSIEVVLGQWDVRPSPPPADRVPSKAPSLSQERWILLGREVKAIRAAVMSLGTEFATARHATQVLQRRFNQVVRAIDSAKCPLDGLVYVQHPGWADYGKVFYGPREPIPGLRNPVP